MTNSTIPYLVQSAAPAAEPVSLAEAKLHLRVDGTEDDNAISAMIAAARLAAEQYTHRSFITQTWQLTYDQYTPQSVRLPRGPVQSVSSVKTIARDATENTLDSTAYYTTAGKTRLVFDAQPIAHMIEITYVAGFGDNASDVPDAICQGILSHVAAMFEARPGDAGIPEDSKVLYNAYRIVRLA